MLFLSALRVKLLHTGVGAFNYAGVVMFFVHSRLWGLWMVRVQRHEPGYANRPDHSLSISTVNQSLLKAVDYWSPGARRGSKTFLWALGNGPANADISQGSGT